MARRTASQLKRNKKSNKAPPASKMSREASRRMTEQNKESDLPGKNKILNIGKTISYQGGDRHPDGCNCFLRKGQMFLPASLLECENNRQPES